MRLSKNGKKLGRPIKPVCQETAQSIVNWVSNGDTLASWCDANGVPMRTVHDWLVKDKVFAAAYARAREDMGDVIAARMRQLAAEPSNHPDDVQHRRLMLDTDKWLLARWYPNRYGDRVGLEHSGGISVTVVTNVPSE